MPPTSPLAREALHALDRPLVAWRDFGEFDSDDFYSDSPPTETSKLEREVRKLGLRRIWRMERVWLPDPESSREEVEAYERACRQVGERLTVPRCLDAYVVQAYQAAEFDDDDPDADAHGDLDWALAWTQAGLSILQQSLPWPFVDVLPYNQIDNRPAHRLLYAHASVLRQRHPRKAVPGFARWST